MTANEAYREYKNDGGTLSFAEWIDREKKKSFLNFDGTVSVPVNKPLTDSINKTLEEIRRQGGLKTGLENKYIFGVHKNVWIGIGVVAVVATAIIVIRKSKK